MPPVTLAWHLDLGKRMAGTDLISRWSRRGRERARAANEVLGLYQDIQDRFRKRPTPMPIVLLHSASHDLDDQVKDTVDELRGIFCGGGLLCGNLSRSAGSGAVVPHLPALPEDAEQCGGQQENPRRTGKLDGSAVLPGYDHALALVRKLADGWDANDPSWDNQARSRYRRYSFPRSGMIAAIEAAYAKEQASEPGSAPDPGKVLRLLSRWSWRRQGSESGWRRLFSGTWPAPGTIAGSILLALFSVEAVHLPALYALYIAAGLVLVAVITRAAVLFRDPLSSLTQASRWFTTTTFLIPATLSGDIPAGHSRAEDSRRVRALRVIEQIAIAEGGGSVAGETEFAKQKQAWQFCLQLRVLAMLEDLRACYRPWSLDLRRRKRTCPPLVVIPRADDENGGLALVRAISDVRSRRSELDPLLLLAGVPSCCDITHRPASSEGHDRTDLSYESWATAMRVDQSPSLRSAWPWVLRYLIDEGALGSQDSEGNPQRPARPKWTLAWSGWSLLLVTALASGGFWVLHARADSRQHQRELAEARELASRYCGGGDLARAPHYLVYSARSPGQCVGIDTTDSVQFVPRDGGVELSGGAPRQNGRPPVGAGITLADVERHIMAGNTKAEAGPHITIVYAGALTSSSDTPNGEMQAASAARELAGIYAFQFHVNSSQTPLIKVDIANGGQDLDSQLAMAQKIVEAARRDPTIVGVAGLGRDTPSSPKVMRILGRAGLAVVDTTNSDDRLGQQWNYFGLEATNAEEVAALRRLIAGTDDKTAVVLVRQGKDTYSDQQSRAAGTMLRRAGFRLDGQASPVYGTALSYPVNNDEANFVSYEGGQASPLCVDRPSVIYLAGRSDDLRNLMSMLGNLPSTCLAPQVTVLSGDDLTKGEVTGLSGVTIPQNTTVYFATGTDIAKTAQRSGLAADVMTAFNLVARPRYRRDPFFADGSVALAFDAAQVLDFDAERILDQPGVQTAEVRTAMPSWLRCTYFPSGATGPIWFSGERHAIETVKIPAGSDSTPLPQHYFPERGPAASGPPCGP